LEYVVGNKKKKKKEYNIGRIFVEKPLKFNLKSSYDGV
jgi:hypothetical protein